MSLPADREQKLERLREIIAAGHPRALDELSALVAIASLSKPGSDSATLMRSAEYVLDLFRPLLPWSRCEVVSVPGGAPAVLARKEPEPGYPTVLLYAHHDVQPAGDESLWTSPPWRAQQRDGRLYGRGSADDGAGIVTHLSAIRALSQLTEAVPPIGVVVFIEGEEESGSPTFAELLETYREPLRADAIIVADSDNPAPDRPALTTSLRGVLGATLRVRTLAGARHSGLFGGPIPDAPGVLIRALASLYRADGSVAIEALRSSAAGVSGVEESDLRAESGLLPGVELWGSGEFAERLWRQPAITVTGFDATSVAEASNTLIPEARARLSVRITPHQRPETAFAALEEHLGAHIPAGVDWELCDREAGEGFDQSAEHSMITLMAESLEWGFGNEVTYQGVGGTIPFVAHLSSAFPDAAIAVTGVEDRQSSAHGIDESVDIAMLERAAASEAMFLWRLGEGRTQNEPHSSR